MSAIFWTGLSFLLLLAAPGGRRHPRLIGLAALLFGLVVVMLSLPFWYPPLKLGLHYNWTGKLLSIVVFLGLIYGFRVVSPAEAGLWRPAPGSLRWVLPVVLGLAAVGFTAGFLERHTHSGASPGWEANLYQLTMPGAEEELFYRGVWLGLLARVFPRTLPLPGTRTSWGGVVRLELTAIVLGGPVFVEKGGVSSRWAKIRSVGMGIDAIVTEIRKYGAALSWLGESSRKKSHGSDTVRILRRGIGSRAFQLLVFHP